jgi:hypothetical protein
VFDKAKEPADVTAFVPADIIGLTTELKLPIFISPDVFMNLQ